MVDLRKAYDVIKTKLFGNDYVNDVGLWAMIAKKNIIKN